MSTIFVSDTQTGQPVNEKHRRTQSDESDTCLLQTRSDGIVSGCQWFHAFWARIHSRISLWVPWRRRRSTDAQPWQLTAPRKRLAQAQHWHRSLRLGSTVQMCMRLLEHVGTSPSDWYLLCDIVWLYDIVWCCVILYDIVWCCVICMILCDVVWYCMILYDVVWYCKICYAYVIIYIYNWKDSGSSVVSMLQLMLCALTLLYCWQTVSE